ncbi:transposase, partial [Virgibacillus sp. M23]
IHSLLDQYELYQSQLTELDMEITDLMKDIPGAQEMMNIKGLGPITIATFLSEVGDLKKYDHPQQLVNMAGLSLREHSSGKFKGQT